MTGPHHRTGYIPTRPVKPFKPGRLRIDGRYQFPNRFLILHQLPRAEAACQCVWHKTDMV